MKQSKTPITIDLSAGFQNNSDITDIELVFQLTKSTKDAILLSNEKKKFLLEVHKNKVDLLRNAQIFDAVLGKDVHDALKSIIPGSSRVINRELKNADLAELIVRLLKPMVILRNYIKSKFDDEKSRKPTFRDSTANQYQMNKSAVHMLLEEAYVLNEKLEQAVHLNRRVPNQSTICKSVFLTTLQRERKWDRSRVPVHSNLRRCVACGHCSTNLPLEMMI